MALALLLSPRAGDWVRKTDGDDTDPDTDRDNSHVNYPIPGHAPKSEYDSEHRGVIHQRNVPGSRVSTAVGLDVQQGHPKSPGNACKHGDKWGRALYGARRVRVQGGCAQRDRQRTPPPAPPRARAGPLLRACRLARAARARDQARRAPHVARWVDAAPGDRGCVCGRIARRARRTAGVPRASCDWPAGPCLARARCRAQHMQADGDTPDCADRQGPVPQSVLQNHPGPSGWRPRWVPAPAPRVLREGGRGLVLPTVRVNCMPSRRGGSPAFPLLQNTATSCMRTARAPSHH